MKQIKIFETRNKNMKAIQHKINDWIDRENIDVHQIETTTGASYHSGNKQYVEEVEIFIIVVYNVKS